MLNKSVVTGKKVAHLASHGKLKVVKMEGLVALAAKQMMDRGEPGDGASLAPNYLRLSQAERERLARENR